MSPAAILSSSPNSKNTKCFFKWHAPQSKTTSTTPQASFMTSKWRSETNVKRVSYVEPLYCRTTSLFLFAYIIRILCAANAEPFGIHSAVSVSINSPRPLYIHWHPKCGSFTCKYMICVCMYICKYYVYT